MVLIKVENNQGKITNENSFSPFYFILYGDIQYGMIRSDIGWYEERELLKTAIKKTNKLMPPFVITLGDLANKFPGSEIQNVQYNDLKHDLKNLDKLIDFYVFPGNHDVGNAPTIDAVKNFEQIWGSSYYSFIYNNCGFLILNSPIFYDSEKVKDLRDEQLKWLEETLKDMHSKNLKHKFLFLHHPLIYDDLYEDENIGVLYMDKINIFVDKNRFHIEKETRLLIYELLKKYEVNHVFSAHLHYNKECKIDSKIKQITISAVGMQIKDDKSGLLIVQVGKDYVDYKYYPFEYVPNLIKM